MTDKKKPAPRDDVARDLLEDADRETGLENKKMHFPASILPKEKPAPKK